MPRKAPKHETETMRQLHDDGMTYREIGELFGMTRNGVIKRLCSVPNAYPPHDPGVERILSPRPSRWGIDFAEKHRQWMERQ